MRQPTDRAAWLKANGAKCFPNHSPAARAFRLVLLGPPGVGKGTQAEHLCDLLGTCHLSTGDVFRAARMLRQAGDGDACGSCGGSSLSPPLRLALEAMARGELIDDETVVSLVAERAGCLHCQYGFLLDGFPRTLSQAEALDAMMDNLHQSLDAVLSYELPMEEIIGRLSGRRTCRGCKATFHLTAKPPRQAGICDHCGGELYQREDDNPISIRTRLDEYEKQTRPLIDYYDRAGLLVTINASGTPEEVSERTFAAIEARLMTRA